MKSFVYNYIDHLTLGIALCFVLWHSLRTWRKTKKTTRLALVFFLYLGPVLLITCMFTHLLEISYHAIETNFTGKFSLRFHLYSLVLMPLVLAEAGRRYLIRVGSFLNAEKPDKKRLLPPAGLVALILFPLLWITPLSFMMLLVFALSFGASFMVHKRKVPKASLDVQTIEGARLAQ